MAPSIQTVALMLAFLALPATPLRARTTLHVRANQPAEVFLDGRRVGLTPLTIPRLQGRHNLRVRSALTGEEQRRRVRAGGRRRHRVETVRARFAPAFPRTFRRDHYRPYRSGYWHDGWYRPYGYGYGHNERSHRGRGRRR